ncbi:MAG TPA: hypothetical protein PKK23_20950 [Nitrospirales bacterium]|nr:hypothetical protein [Nitrospiraceae bacterium]HNP31528.1 hypothetical protein [Nitrospirales bacterium]
MADPIRLIHPIYLDVPMLVSFAAAIEGGMSFGAEVTMESSKSKSLDTNVSGKASLSKLFANFVDVSAQGSVSGDIATTERSVQKEARAHTEASVAIVLYERLRQDGGYIVDPQRIEDLDSVKPGALVEIAGTIEKNAIDSIIDYIDAVVILSEVASSEGVQLQIGTGSQKKNPKKAQNPQTNQISQIREALHKDRARTPFSNTIMRCSVPQDATAIVTLRTENLRDLTLSELHKNSVRVLGKVTRVVRKGQSVCPFENYGMALLKPELLEDVMNPITSSEGVNAELTEVRLEGPAIQILPLMVFV